MSSFSIEGWCKTGSTEQSTPVEPIHFYINGNDRQRLEQAEVHLQNSDELEVMVDVDMTTLELRLPQDYGPLSDCKLRVYLHADDKRGHFHLVGQRWQPDLYQRGADCPADVAGQSGGHGQAQWCRRCNQSSSAWDTLSGFSRLDRWPQSLSTTSCAPPIASAMS
jgi:hypothetical protein